MSRSDTVVEAEMLLGVLSRLCPGERQVRLAKMIALAFLIENADERAVCLQRNALIVTRLREEGLWPIPRQS